MQCLALAVVSTLLLSVRAEENVEQYKQLLNTVDGCLAYFDKTRDDLENIIVNGALDESTEFPAEMTLCVFRGLGIFQGDNDKFSKNALIKFLISASAKNANDKIDQISAVATNCGEKVESLSSPITEKSKLLMNCLLQHKTAHAHAAHEQPQTDPSLCHTKCADVCAVKCRSSLADERTTRVCTLKCAEVCHYKCKKAATQNHYS